MPFYRRIPNVEESPLQGDLMLFEPDRGQFFVLNRSMAHVWRCCDGQHSLAQMVESAGRAFADAPVHTVQADFSAALEQLLQLGLVAAANAQNPVETSKEAV